MLSSLRPLAARLVPALAIWIAACGGDPPTTPPGTQLPGGRPVVAADYRPSGRAAAGDVSVHLFEWRWADIATECEQVLGPAGLARRAGVAAAGARGHQRRAVVAALPAGELQHRPEPLGDGRRVREAWWSRCRAAGVDIYVDAVHQPHDRRRGTGSNGTVYTKYQLPGHLAGRTSTAPCGWQLPTPHVQDCELVGSPTFDTGSAVGQRLADYLDRLAAARRRRLPRRRGQALQPAELDGDRPGNRARAEGRPLPYGSSR
jgi:alpha-amylase